MRFFGTGLKQLRDKRAWHPLNGWSIRRSWKGTPANVASVMTSLIAEGRAFEHDTGEDNGVNYDIVTITLGAEETQPSDQELTDQWALLGNDLEKDIWRHPKVAQLMSLYLDPNGYPTREWSDKRSDLLDLVSGEKAIPANPANPNAETEITWWNDITPAGKQFVRTLLRGITSFTVSQFVLRNTKKVARNYSLKPDLSRVGKIMTGEQLTSAYPIPSTIKFNLPAGHWLERTPSVEQISAEKFSIVREWWNFDEYDDFIYDQVT